MSIRFVILLIFTFFISMACLWDNDTLEMETRQFPGTLELITGKFLRHSDEFHEWRIQDRLERIEKYPDSIQYYDDLAVSYSKLKRDKEAIEVMKLKDKIVPGKYETYANMGTFYIHDGDLENGIKYIDKALEINPEAHFGREKYQKYLAEYLLNKNKNGRIMLPLCKRYEKYEDSHMGKKDSFYYFLLRKFNTSNKTDSHSLPKEELLSALKGIKGMMKFGNFNSPILLEIFSGLMYKNGGMKGSPLNHMALAFYNASLNVNDSLVAKKYVKLAMNSLTYRSDVRDRKGEILKMSQIHNGIGEEYFQEIRENELKWIADSTKNPEVEFAKLYYKKDISSKYPELDSDSIQNQSIQSKEETSSKPADYSQLLWFGLLVLGAVLAVWKFSKYK